MGTKTLGDILSDRESIALEMQTVLDEGTEPWGVKVERVEVTLIMTCIILTLTMTSMISISTMSDTQVKDVRVSEQLQRT